MGPYPNLLALALCGSAASAVVTAPLPFSLHPITFDGGGWVTGLEVHAATGIVYARTDVGGAYVSPDAGDSWTWLSGAIEGDTWGTQGLAVNQSDTTGQTLLLGVGTAGKPSNWTGVYKSIDGGKTFVHTLAGVAFAGNQAQRHASPCLAIDASRPWRVWAAPQQGLYLSEDGGATWAAVPGFAAATGYNASDLQTGLSFVSLVPPPAEGPLQAHVVVGSRGAGLGFSADDGRTWTHIQNVTSDAGAAFSISNPYRFTRCPNGTAFLGSADGTPAWKQHVLRVTASDWAHPAAWVWHDITPAAPPLPSAPAVGWWSVMDVPYGFGPGSVLLAGAQYPDSLYESGDSGDSWVKRNMSVTANFPVWWSTDPGHTYVPFGRNAVVVSRLQPQRWLVASGFGVFASADRGETWAGASAGIGQVVMFRCNSHPARPNLTACGAMDLVGFTVGAGGAAASLFNHLPTYWGADFGKRPVWRDWTAGGSPALLWAANEQENGAYGQLVAWDDPLGAGNASVVACRDTAGALNNLSFHFAELHQSADDPTDLLMGVSGASQYYPWNTSEPDDRYMGGIVRSRDGGASWAHVAAQPRDGVIGGQYSDFGQLARDGGDADAVWYGNCNFGLFLSRDRGEHWAAVGPWGMWQQMAVAPDVTSGAGAVWVLSTLDAGGALRRTRDYGATWATVGNFTILPNPAPNFGYPFIAASRSGARLALVAAAGSDDAHPHVHVSTDGGATFTQIDSAAAGTALGPYVTGLEWDALDETLLYVSTGGRSLLVVRLAA